MLRLTKLADKYKLPNEITAFINKAVNAGYKYEIKDNAVLVVRACDDNPANRSMFINLTDVAHRLTRACKWYVDDSGRVDNQFRIELEGDK